MRPILCSFAALALLALLAGCKDDSLVNPEPDPPVFIRDPFLTIDTTTASTLGVPRVRFSWETDRTSIDVMYYGAGVEAMNDSVAAQNADTPAPGDSVKHLHQAPRSGLAPLNVPAHQAFYYRMRALGANGTSGFTRAYRYVYSG